MRWFVPLVLIPMILAAPARASEPLSVEAIGLGEVGAIAVDGLLDEPAWAMASPITEFVGILPTEGLPPEAATSVRVLFDDRYVYFGFECALADPADRVRSYVAAREDINRDDQVGIYLDPFGDARRAYVFYINAHGVQQDMLVTIDGYWSGSWDALFKSAGHSEPGRYSVEVAIPWRSLRFPKVAERPWRVRFTRRFGASQDKASWPFVRADGGHMLLQFAELRGLEPKRSGIGVELQPSLVLRTGLDRDPATDTLRWRTPGFPDTVDPSLGVKWQIGPSVTLDAAVNPDFSQVEADPNFLDNNLRFPLFLDERRPFFLEGKELYDSSLLYSRSVVDPLYGIKLSGKLRRVSIAVLHALDETPAPSLLRERPTPGFDRGDTEDAVALVSFVGSRLDLPARSSLGVAFSDKELLRGGAHTAGSRAARVDGVWGIDPVSSLKGALALSQTGEVDGDQLVGAAGSLGVGRRERFGGFDLGGSFVTPGHRVENGFNTTVDRLRFSAGADARAEPPTGPVAWIVSGLWFSSGLQEVSTGGQHDTADAGGFSVLRLPALTEVEGWSEAWTTRFAGRDFSGGRTGFNASNRALDWLEVGVSGWVGDSIRYADASPSFVRNLSVDAAFRALRRLKLDLSWSVSALGAQGERLDVDQVYRARLRVALTQALSLRLIAQGSIDERLQLSALFAINPSAGTAIYVGYGHRFEHIDGGPLEQTAIDLFLKGTFLLRL